MSQTSNVLSVEECQAIIQRWQKEGLTQDERHGLVAMASAVFTDSTQMADFQEKISSSVNFSKQIDAVFLHVDKTLASKVLVIAFLFHEDIHAIWVAMIVVSQRAINYSQFTCHCSDGGTIWAVPVTLPWIQQIFSSVSASSSLCAKWYWLTRFI